MNILKIATLLSLTPLFSTCSIKKLSSETKPNQSNPAIDNSESTETQSIGQNIETPLKMTLIIIGATIIFCFAVKFKK